MIFQRRFVITILTFVVLAASTSCATARHGAWTHAQEYYAAGDYLKAIREAEQLLGYGTPSLEERANVYLLQARCYERLGELDQAIGLYVFVSKTFPETPHDYQARAALSRMERQQPARKSDGI